MLNLQQNSSNDAKENCLRFDNHDSPMVPIYRIILWCAEGPFLLWLYLNDGSFPEPDGIVYCTEKFPVIVAEEAKCGLSGEELARLLWQ